MGTLFFLVVFSVTKYYYRNQVKEYEMGETCSTRGEMTNVYNILGGKPDVKRPCLGPRHRWDDNIRMDPTAKQ
jgi:hypothetical protein